MSLFWCLWILDLNIMLNAVGGPSFKHVSDCVVTFSKFKKSLDIFKYHCNSYVCFKVNVLWYKWDK